MTQTTKEIFERFEVRKTAKQKQAFREYVLAFCRQNGYTAQVEKGAFGAKNIVVGDVDTAKVVYTAHYDTCAVLPFPNFITPKKLSIYIAYQAVLVVVIILAMFLVGFVFGLLGGMLGAALYSLGWTSAWVVIGILFPILAYVLMMAALFAGPANRHTANDNTSGVTVLLDVMAALPAEDRQSAAFVFFDLEEAGMLGSSGFAKKHKKQMTDKPLVNFDCVSDGDTMLFALRPKAAHLQATFEKAFPSTEAVTSEVATKGVFYPSDQMCFPQGVGVAALKMGKKTGVLYMDRIHTPKDTVYREDNIAYLTAGALRLPALL